MREMLSKRGLSIFDEAPSAPSAALSFTTYVGVRSMTHAAGRAA
jgi:hypothetical protein